MNVRAPPADDARLVEAEFEQVGLPASDPVVDVAPGVDVDPGRWSRLGRARFLMPLADPAQGRLDSGPPRGGRGTTSGIGHAVEIFMVAGGL